MAEQKSLAMRGAGAETKKIAGAITSMGIDELIFNMAKGIADGQARLDETCMQLAMKMGDAQIEFGKIPGTNEPDVISLVELGFTPNFYQFVDTILEVRVSVSSSYEEEKETSTSEVDQQQNEMASQQQYANSRNNNYSGYGYSGGYSVGWGGNSRGYGYGVGWGGSGYGYSGGSSSSQSGNSAQKSKAVKVNTVDASFSSKYAYSVEASSLIKTKIVPVPPPQVLEEAVQSKAKERKEWAKRFALLRFSKNLLPAIGDSSVAAASLIEPYTSVISSDDKDKYTAPDPHLAYQDASDIGIALVSLKEEYDKLTNDHWSVIENIKDRRILDNAMENFTSATEEIEAAYIDGVLIDEEGKPETFYRKLIAQHGKLDKIKSKIDEIMLRLPLTPEEMANQEEENANNA